MKFPHIPMGTRRYVIGRDNNTCQKCKSADAAIEIHHLIPVSLNGNHEPGNLTCLCRKCHAGAHRAMGFGHSAGDHQHGYETDTKIVIDIPPELNTRINLSLIHSGLDHRDKGRLFLYAIGKMIEEPLHEDFIALCLEAKNEIREKQKKRYQERTQ